MINSVYVTIVPGKISFGITFVVETMRVTVIFLFACVTLTALTEVNAAELEKTVSQTLQKRVILYEDFAIIRTHHKGSMDRLTINEAAATVKYITQKRQTVI